MGSSHCCAPRGSGSDVEHATLQSMNGTNQRSSPTSIWTSGKWIRRGQVGCRCDWAGAPAGYAPKRHGQRAVGTGVAGCDGRPPVINRFPRPCRDLSAGSPIRLDHAREQSAHRCRVRFRNLGILIASPSSVEIPSKRNAQPQSEIEECPVRPL